MTRSHQINPDVPPLEPECQPTVARIQGVLDGEVPASALEADPHLVTCPICRRRVRAARLLLASFTTPAMVPVSSGLTDRILAAVRSDRRARLRRRLLAGAGGLAVAATVLVAIGLQWFNGRSKPIEALVPGPELVAAVPPAAPSLPVPPEQAPAPRVQITSELARARDAFRDSLRPITEPTTGAPDVIPNLTALLPSRTTTPVGHNLEPARQSLAEIPEAAKSGLEPLAGSAQKAFGRLLRDVAAIQPTVACNPNPDS